MRPSRRNPSSLQARSSSLIGSLGPRPNIDAKFISAKPVVRIPSGSWTTRQLYRSKHSLVRHRRTRLCSPISVWTLHGNDRVHVADWAVLRPLASEIDQPECLVPYSGNHLGELLILAWPRKVTLGPRRYGVRTIPSQRRDRAGTDG
jgi:hypothetical protein